MLSLSYSMSCTRAPLFSVQWCVGVWVRLESVRAWVVHLVPAMMGGRERSRTARWCVPLRVVCVCVAVLLVSLASVESMTMEVFTGDEKCVIIYAGKGSTINANYEV